MPGFQFPNLDNNRIEILKAALPYMNKNSKKPMQFMIQVEELTSSLKSIDNEPSVTAFDLNESSADMESMLLHIRDVCTSKDQETVDFILNFIKTQKLYQSYHKFMSNKNPSGNISPFGLGNNNYMLEFLMSQLTPDQKSTFETLSTMMNTMQNN